MHGTHAKPFQTQFYCANHVKQIEQETARKTASKLNRKDKKRKMLGNGICPTTILYFLDIVILCFVIYISLGRGSWLSSWSPAPSNACVAEALVRHWSIRGLQPQNKTLALSSEAALRPFRLWLLCFTFKVSILKGLYYPWQTYSNHNFFSVVSELPWDSISIGVFFFFCFVLCSVLD